MASFLEIARISGQFGGIVATLAYDFDSLRTAGYTGSLVEMRRQNLLALLSLTEPQSLSNADLEMQYLRSIGKTGSIMDMRKQLP